MSSTDKSISKRCRWPLGIAALLAITAAVAQVAPGGTGLDTSGNYQGEVRACREGRTAEDGPTCLREARNAQAERKLGHLDNASNDFAANALARCAPLMNDEKTACEARMAGQGQVSGSVAGGGLLREIEIVVAAPAAGAITSQPTSTDPVASPPAAQ